MIYLYLSMKKIYSLHTRNGIHRVKEKRLRCWSALTLKNDDEVVSAVWDSK